MRHGSCCPKSTSPSTARWYRPGRARGVSGGGTAGAAPAPTIPATRRSTSTASVVRMRRTGRPPSPTRLAKRGPGQEAKLAYQGHVLMDNRHALAVATSPTSASGTAERATAVHLVRTMPSRHHQSPWEPTRATTPASASRNSGPRTSPRTSRSSRGDAAAPWDSAPRGIRAMFTASGGGSGWRKSSAG